MASLSGQKEIKIQPKFDRRVTKMGAMMGVLEGGVRIHYPGNTKREEVYYRYPEHLTPSRSALRGLDDSLQMPQQRDDGTHAYTGAYSTPALPFSRLQELEILINALLLTY